jgi:hypothetical protein
MSVSVFFHPLLSSTAPVMNIALTSAVSLASSHSPSISPPSNASSSNPDHAVDMKDVAATSSRHTRNTVYPKKRPSPHGIQKRAKASPIYASVATASSSRRETPAARAALLAKKQREAQVLALHRDGVLLEEEYREDARCYMHEMEVSFLVPTPVCFGLTPKFAFFSR